MKSRSRSFAAAMAVAVISSVLLCWLPVLGPALSGFAGHRRSRGFVGLLAVGLVAVAWTAALTLASQRELNVGGTMVALGPLGLLAPVFAGAMLGGALVACKPPGVRGIGFVLVLVALGFGITRVAEPVWSMAKGLRSGQAYVPESNKTCPENLKQLYNAMMLYADSWDGTLPPSGNWLTVVRANVPADTWLRCPDVAREGSGTYGYGMNAEMGGKRIADVTDKRGTPLLFESQSLAENVVGGLADAAKPGRHMGRNNVLYLDGHVEAVVP